MRPDPGNTQPYPPGRRQGDPRRGPGDRRDEELEREAALAYIRWIRDIESGRESVDDYKSMLSYLAAKREVSAHVASLNEWDPLDLSVTQEAFVDRLILEQAVRYLVVRANTMHGMQLANTPAQVWFDDVTTRES